MERPRVADEVIEIFCHQLHTLPLQGEDPEFDYESQALVPDLTADPLDIQEVSMAIEDAFGVYFQDIIPGDPGMKTIGEVIDYVAERIQKSADRSL